MMINGRGFHFTASGPFPQFAATVQILAKHAAQADGGNGRMLDTFAHRSPKACKATTIGQRG